MMYSILGTSKAHRQSSIVICQATYMVTLVCSLLLLRSTLQVALILSSLDELSS